MEIFGGGSRRTTAERISRNTSRTLFEVLCVCDCAFYITVQNRILHCFIVSFVSPRFYRFEDTSSSFKTKSTRGPVSSSSALGAPRAHAAAKTSPWCTVPVAPWRMRAPTRYMPQSNSGGLRASAARTSSAASRSWARVWDVLTADAVNAESLALAPWCPALSTDHIVNSRLCSGDLQTISWRPVAG